MIQKCKTNFRQGWRTTVVGIVLISVGLGLFIDQRETLTEITAYSFGGLVLLGGLLLVAPDSIVSIVKEWVKAKFK